MSPACHIPAPVSSLLRPSTLIWHAAAATSAAEQCHSVPAFQELQSGPASTTSRGQSDQLRKLFDLAPDGVTINTNSPRQLLL